MNKSIAVMLAGAALLTSAVSCGKDADSSDGSKASSQELSGDYLTIMPLDDQPALIEGELDSYIEDVLSKNAGFDKGLIAPYVQQKKVSFEDGGFKSSQTYGQMMDIVFSGKFSENGKKIVFSYESAETVSSSGTSETISVDEKPEPYDNDIVLGKKEASNEVYTAEVKKKIRATWIEQLKDMSKDGKYLARISPCVYSVDVPFDMLPAFYVLNRMRGDPPCDLYHLGKLLGYETYGLSVEGKYVRGEDFVLDFDQLAVYNEDPFSPCKPQGGENKPQKSVEDIAGQICSDYGLKGSDTDTSSVISFSGGKWEWKNSAGSLINNGSYKESKEYPGLIAMYTDSSSKRNYAEFHLDEGYDTLMFCIADDGKVYYPYFAKIS